MSEKLKPPVSYQGGKQRLAEDIVSVLLERGCGEPYYDLCCGSGAIGIELVNRKILPRQIVMVDAGPWGLFWEAIGKGDFDVAEFEKHCGMIPTDRSQIRDYVKELSRQPVGEDAKYIFPILQAASFGGKAIWIHEGRWRNTSFRSFWQPTATSNRRSVVNPMMPMPKTLVERVTAIAKAMTGVLGLCQRVEDTFVVGGTIYVDPPYANTTGYGHTLDVKDIAGPCFVSEGLPLSDDFVCLSKGRSKGGVSGSRKAANEEYVSYLAS